MKTVLVPLAGGVEEIEAITIIDILRRAELNVTTVALADRTVSGAHGINVIADKTLSEVKDSNFDALILPGGMPGTTNLLESEELKKLIKTHFDSSKLTGAICAAPWVLSDTGVLKGKTATCYPGFEDKFSDTTEKSTDRVVVDDNVITSRGPGTAMEFALKIVEKMRGDSVANNLREGLIAKA